MEQFHFDLTTLTDDSDLAVVIGGNQFPLREHTNITLTAAARSNLLLDRLEDSVRRFTHYADITAIPLSSNAVTLVSVVRMPPEGVHLPQIIRMTHYIPAGALRAFFRSQFDIYRRPLTEVRSFFRSNIGAQPTSFSAVLHDLGILELPKNDEEALDLLVSANALMNSLTTAGSLVALHPNLANIQPSTTAIVMYDHILPDPKVDPEQYNAMQVLARTINEVGDNWLPVVMCHDKDGNPLKAGYDLDPSNGGFKTGQQLYTQDVDDKVYQVLPAPIARANRTASNDLRLSGKTWAPQTGVSTLTQNNTTAPTPDTVKVVSTSTSFKWTVNEQTSHHGVNVEKSSITIDGNNFSIDAGNSYLRTLYVGYQLKNDRGENIGKIKTLYSISATNTIMGIPMPTNPTRLNFDLKDAAQVELLFGSLGTSDWQVEVSNYGALLTGLWQYGIPGIFIVAGKVITSTATFNKIVSDRELSLVAIAIGIPLIGAGTATYGAITNYKKAVFALADIAISLVVQKGLEKLGKWITEQVTAGQLSNAFGPVGLIIKLAAVSVDFAQMAVTTYEVLSSPATVRVKVSRAIDVAFTLHPDPKHGEGGHPETAVWPSIATRYQVTLQYKNGTSFVEKGPLPTTSNTPLVLKFDDVPAGGEFQIIAGVYSTTGWLAGSWQRDSIKAIPNSGSTLDLGNQNIKENLVPLAPDTQYAYKEEIAFVNNTFQWIVGQPAAATVNSLNCGDDGSLCQLVGITINNSAFQIGYAWRASGQNLFANNPSSPKSNKQLYAVQNLSVSAEPSSRLIQTEIGFTNQPQIAYAPSVSDTQINQQNFVLDPRAGGMNLRQVELNKKLTEFGFGDPNLKSWGKFPLQNIDALAVHPSNLVIGVSFQDHKMLLAALPPAGVLDDNAEEALIVSGEGIRQGLMNGPVALAIAPDGRILVLESVNKRVQAFDTKGNPVPSFTWMPTLFKLTTSDISADLDGGKIPAAFINALVDSQMTYQFDISNTFVSQLDGGKFSPSDDPLIEKLSEQGVILSYDPSNMSDPALSAQIQVVTSGKAWTITDPRGYAWRLSLGDDLISVFSVPAKATVQVQTEGQRWLLTDLLLGQSWQFSPSTADPTKTLVDVALSYFPLKALSQNMTYLDMGVEAEGHVYVLSHTNDGSATTDYYLDIYAPDGELLSRTPDPSVTTSPQNLVAGKIAVDIWRNLYALGFGVTKGPDGAVQPHISHWTPTPPLFSTDLSLQAALNAQNITVVTQAFQQNNITLSNQAGIFINNPEGSWTIKDGNTSYDIYRTGGELQVYKIPA